MSGRLYLPALQAEFGDWLYYVGLMKLADLSERVGYAREIHHNVRLSELIQRQLEDSASTRRNRVTDIKDYLVETKDRFFNSLVVGVYGAEPQWHPFSVRPKNDSFDALAMKEANREAVGFLELSGGERLFALDGQHRLAGIKSAIAVKPELGIERLSVIFVAHSPTQSGLQRTRALFISLNKKAVPVAKRDIIALDENDVPAIVTRQLVDDHSWFSRGQIDIDRFTPNLPSDSTALLTLDGFYDVVNVVIRKVMAVENQSELKLAERARLRDDRLDYYRELVLDYFRRISRLDHILQEYFRADNFGEIALAARTPEAPRLLFRPIGQLILAQTAAELRRKASLNDVFKLLRMVPTLLDQPPFREIIWDTSRARILNRGRSLATRLLVYMLTPQKATEKLKQSYAAFLGRPGTSIKLPPKLI